MKVQTKKTERIDLIIDCLKSRNGQEITISNLTEYVNEHVLIGNPITQRTIESDLHYIRTELKIDINYKREGKKCFYSIDSETVLVDEIIEDFGILLQLINTHSELDSVYWLKDVLKTDYNIDESYFENDDFFLLPKPKNENHDTILTLAVDIVKYAKNGQAIQFYYYPANIGKRESAKCVAPLQVKFFDGRYYLVALDLIDFDNYKEYGTTPILYSLDSIEGLNVNAAQKEFEDLQDVKNEDDFNIYFDHTHFSKKIGLKNYFNDCIGVVRPKNQVPKKIKLKFTDWARSYVLNQPIHTSQKVISNGDELLIEIYVYDTFELDFSLGRFREFCNRIK